MVGQGTRAGCLLDELLAGGRGGVGYGETEKEGGGFGGAGW